MDATSYDVNTTSFWHQMPAGDANILLSEHIIGGSCENF